MTTKQALEAAGVTYSSLTNLVIRGKITRLKLDSGRVMYDDAEIAKYAEYRKTKRSRTEKAPVFKSAVAK